MERRAADRGVDAPNYYVGDYDYWVAAPRDEPMVRSILARIATGNHGLQTPRVDWVDGQIGSHRCVGCGAYLDLVVFTAAIHAGAE